MSSLRKSPRRSASPHQQSVLQQQQDALDPYSPLIVQDMLKGHNEWRSVQDIVKLTLKALCDVVKSQGQALREVERHLPQLAKRKEMEEWFNQKADLSEVQRVISELENQLQEIQASTDDDKVSKVELTYLLSNKVSLQEVQKMTDCKTNNLEFSQAFAGLELKVAHMYEDLSKKASQAASLKDVAYLTAQLDLKADLQEMTEQLSQKASKTSVQTAIQRKANKQDIEALLELKCDLTDLDKIIQIIETKQDRPQVNKLIADQNYKSQIDQLSAFVDQSLKSFDKQLLQATDCMESKLDELRGSMCDVLGGKADYVLLDKLRGDLEKAVKRHELDSVLARLRQDTETQIETAICESDFARRTITLDKNISQSQNQLQLDLEKVQHEIQWVRENIKQSVQERSKELDEVGKLVKTLVVQSKQESQLGFDKVKKEIARVEAWQEQQMKSKVDLSEVQKALSDFQVLISDQLVQYMSESEGKVHEMVGKSYQSLQSNHQDEHKIADLRTDLQMFTDKFTKQLDRKSNIKDVCALLDLKANIDDVNKALHQINVAVDLKVNRDQYLQQQDEQRIVNEVLCQENCLARWQWQSGNLRNEIHAVPWETQCANSCPENFIQQEDKSVLVAVEAGLYEVKMAFFSQFKATIDLRVNGESIITTVGNQPNVVHHGSQGRINGRSQYQALTGLTMLEYVALPSNARVSVCFNTQHSIDTKQGEGFIQLRKL